MPTLDHQSSNVPNFQIISPERRKRPPRAAIACESCRKVKLKCDQKHPCGGCVRNGHECIYPDKRPRISKAALYSRTRSLSSAVASLPLKARDISIQPSHHSKGITKSRKFTSSDDEAQPKHSKPVTPKMTFIPIAARPPATSFSNDRPTPYPDNFVEINKENIVGNHSRPEGEPGPHGFGEVNKYTSGTEFYGPTATLAFLIELQSRARSFQTKSSQIIRKDSTKGSKLGRTQMLSIVNFFHGDDQTTSETSPEQPFVHDEYRSHHLSQGPSEPSPSSSHLSHQLVPNVDIEKECIQLYFANLHLIYYFLDKAIFIDRCEDEIWSGKQQSSGPRHRRNSKFPALYNAVISVGAITAGDDTVVAQSRDRVQGFMEDHSNKITRSSDKTRPTYPPLELAQVYFARAKTLLGDLFEASSLESTQTLILMSIFCQYALKLHECYMYSGMAARTALAIGSANEPDIGKNPIQATRTWWCLYYHEMEVCCSLGRETFLREPAYYPVYFAKFPDPMPSIYAKNDNTLFFARANTELANILKQTSEEIYHSGSVVAQNDKYQAALKLDESLLLWKSQLSSAFDFENASLTEPETITKRKVVLKLRYYSARILIHRPFLVAAAYQGSSSSFTSNIKHCLDASQETINLLYETFVNRPFFRTWWYNTTYAFNAITIILYAIVSHLQRGNSSELFKAVEKSLKIFQAMSGIAVARRCAELTEEIFVVAQMSVEAQQRQRIERNKRTLSLASLVTGIDNYSASSAPMGTASSNNISSLLISQTELSQPRSDMWGGMDAFNMDTSALEEDFFASLIDPSILDSFGANLMGGDLMNQPFFEGLDFGQGFGV